jgi:hypothetical protein
VTAQIYRWFWKAKLPDRRGQIFRVLARGKMNSCLIEFDDGWRVITSRNALRKVCIDETASAEVGTSSGTDASHKTEDAAKVPEIR